MKNTETSETHTDLVLGKEIKLSVVCFVSLDTTTIFIHSFRPVYKTETIIKSEILTHQCRELKRSNVHRRRHRQTNKRELCCEKKKKINMRNWFISILVISIHLLVCLSPSSSSSFWSLVCDLLKFTRKKVFKRILIDQYFSCIHTKRKNELSKWTLLAFFLSNFDRHFQMSNVISNKNLFWILHWELNTNITTKLSRVNDNQTKKKREPQKSKPNSRSRTKH